MIEIINERDVSDTASIIEILKEIEWVDLQMFLWFIRL